MSPENWILNEEVFNELSIHDEEIAYLEQQNGRSEVKDK